MESILYFMILILTNKKYLLGRSQVVRQRFLVSPCAGSNPAGPDLILANEL